MLIMLRLYRVYFDYASGITIILRLYFEYNDYTGPRLRLRRIYCRLYPIILPLHFDYTLGIMITLALYFWLYLTRGGLSVAPHRPQLRCSAMDAAAFIPSGGPAAGRSSPTRTAYYACRWFHSLPYVLQLHSPLPTIQRAEPHRSVS
jgi:hypothetical protein